jgi:hypothetical protein
MTNYLVCLVSIVFTFFGFMVYYKWQRDNFVLLFWPYYLLIVSIMYVCYLFYKVLYF